MIAAATAVGLALLLSLARSAHARSTAPVLTVGPFTDAEGYTYSAVWLAFGVVLLIVGIFLRSQPARISLGRPGDHAHHPSRCSCGHGGPHRRSRALPHRPGLVLVGIGYVYQRLLFRKPPQAEAAA